MKKRERAPSPDDIIIKIKPERERWFKRHKVLLIIIAIVLITLVVGGVLIYFLVVRPGLNIEQKDWHHQQATEEEESEPVRYYSVLSGEEIADESLNSQPTFCMQIPNGMDVSYPRTHVGLSQIPIVFEAIAERGITRFAGIFQNPTSSMLGPIRSLRIYYLDWDVPFDCTIVHAGGSPEAIAAARAYKDLTENYAYMYRDYSTYVAPNNLFTSPALLSQFALDAGYTKSHPVAFPRLTPKEAEEARSQALVAASPSTTKNENGEEVEVPPTQPLVTTVNINFGYNAYFNLVYSYDATSNSYLRSYATGEAHYSYNCPADLPEPNPSRDCGAPVQVAPKVLVAMYMNEWLDTDGYHEVISTIGSGEAYIFQNGTAQHATWSKSAREAQIEFKDDAGNLISFVPGQMWIHAVPVTYGGGVGF